MSSLLACAAGSSRNNNTGQNGSGGKEAARTIASLLSALNSRSACSRADSKNMSLRAAVEVDRGIAAARGAWALPGLHKQL